MNCLVNAVLELNASITIKYAPSTAPMPNLDRVTLWPIEKNLLRAKSFIYDKTCSWILSKILFITSNKTNYKCFDLIIGVDRFGLIEAGLINEIYKTPYIFFSFEIMFEAENSKRYKEMERRASRNVSLWFAQDEIRGAKLQTENRLNPKKHFYIPLASLGLGDVSRTRLRDQLGIAELKKCALMIGSLTTWSLAKEVVESTSRWPSDWTLIIHDRYGNTANELLKLGLDLSKLDGDQIYLSSSAVTKVDDMSEIFSGVDVGLAFYQPDSIGPYAGQNLEYLGLASGKISTFLRYGVPIIMNNIGLYSELAVEHEFGLVVSAPSALPAALAQLPNHELRENAKKFYTKQLDFNNYKNDLVKAIFSTAM